MKHLLKLTLLLLAILLPATAVANPITLQQAQQNALSFLEGKGKSISSSSLRQTRLRSTSTTTESYYIFNIGSSSGYNQNQAAVINAQPKSIISFADDDVKAICVEHWDTDGDGELSEEEAAAVTTLGNAFTQNDIITSFNELRYFTGITIIEEWAFYDCIHLASITIPSNVTLIGVRAFCECLSLKSITIPSSVTSIGGTAFSGCDNLTSITISSGVSDIGFGAFYGCLSLTSITIPSSVTSIGENAFLYCYSLESINVDADNMVYDSRDNCNAIIETSTNQLILGCKNTIIPSSATIISDAAFAGCSGLTSITIPSSITSIGISAFDCCTGLTSIMIPSSVTSIGSYAFSGCDVLNDVYSEISDPSQVTMGNNAFSRSPQNYSNRRLHVPVGSLAAYRNDSKWSDYFGSIVVIGIPSTTNIVFADRNVKAICTQRWDTNGDGELSEGEAAAVTSLDGAFSSNEEITSFDELAFFTELTAIEDSAFIGCSGLKSIKIPSNVTSIGFVAFAGCSGLMSITIPSSVTIIGYEAFSDCHAMTSIDIYGSPFIEGMAFYRCNSLTRVNISSLNAWCGVNCDFMGNPLQYAEHLYLNGVEIIDLVIPDSVTIIGKHAFDGSNHLKSVTIPSTVVKIGESAFFCCDSLERVYISDMKAWCNILFEFTEGPYDDMYDYYNDSSNPLAYAHHLYLNGQEIINLIIPESTTKIGQFAFTRCNYLESVTIPNSVVSIGIFAFYLCELNDFYSFIPDPSQISMGDYLFNIWDHVSGTLHVPAGSLAAYQDDTNLSPYFGSIVEMGPMVATSIELDRSTAILEPGETLQLKAELQPIEAMYNEVLWGSSNPDVATISNDGLVTAVNVGTATITAMTTDGSNLSASCVVTVCTEIMGDADCNGAVNISDVTALIDYLLSGDASAIVLSNADCDGSGAVNISDVTLLIDYLLTGHWQEEPEPTPEVTSFTVNGVTFKMVTIEGGTFTMGATDEQGDDALDREKPAHQVTLSSFRIGETEVTQELWEAVMGSNPSNFSSRNGYPENLSLPVEYVSWNSCQTFISKLNELTGEHFRLPTEAEWEFAARGGTRSMGFKYAGSNDIDAVAWYKDNSNSITHTVGSKAPTSWACMTCQVTCGSGVRIGLIITLVLLRPTQRAPLLARSACTVAADGATTPVTAGYLAEAAVIQRMYSPTSDFASPSIKRFIIGDLQKNDLRAIMRRAGL